MQAVIPFDTSTRVFFPHPEILELGKNFSKFSKLFSRQNIYTVQEQDLDFITANIKIKSIPIIQTVSIEDAISITAKDAYNIALKSLHEFEGKWDSYTQEEAKLFDIFAEGDNSL